MRTPVPYLHRRWPAASYQVRRLCKEAEAAESTEAPAATRSISSNSRQWPQKLVREVAIVAARRTPIGAYGGSLSSLTACQLGSITIRAALEDAKLTELIQERQLSAEVFLGNVLSAGIGQAPARQAALGAGLPPHTVCTTINKVCASGMKAVVLGAQSITLGLAEVVIAGGMESMSNAPYVLPRTSKKNPVGHVNLQDSILSDGLWDPHKKLSMGSIAESTAREMGISRQQQDDHAVHSYERAAAAQAKGIFKSEIVPVTVEGRKGRPPTAVTADEEVSKFDPDKLLSLKPAFESDGTITAGNASSISDGAAVLVLTSSEYAEKNGLPILARIRGYADAEQAPERYATSPALAIPRALEYAGLGLADASLFEINEAFSVVDLANRQLLGLQEDQVNVHGGAVALGHPIGASGARNIISLITALAYRNEDVGVAAVCNGGGGATAVVIEREISYRLHEHEHGH